MKFGIKKSHEMISSIPIGIAPLSKPCKLSQMTLNELYNKSHEGFMMSKCQENAPIWPKTLV
jgi:hypothetical protein